MLVALIIACEVAFWVVLGLGLLVRYALRWRRVSTVLLWSVPLIDLVLLVATVLDLRRGATADWSHGLAAAYIGFSVAFGHDMMRWADQRYAHRFAGGPPPWKPPRYGRAKIRYEWVTWLKAAGGWAVACGLLGLGILYVDDPARTEQLWQWMGRLTVVIVVWLVGWPVWVTLAPPRPKHTDEPAPR